MKKELCTDHLILYFIMLLCKSSRHPESQRQSRSGKYSEMGERIDSKQGKTFLERKKHFERETEWGRQNKKEANKIVTSMGKLKSH